MKNTLVIAELDQHGLKKSTLCTMTAAKQLGQPIDLLLIGSHARAHSAKAALLTGVHQVIVNSHPCYHHLLAENISQLVLSLANNYQAILAPATSSGKDFMPRVAALLNVAQISDITQIIDATTFVRPIYAGNALATVQSQDPIKVITVRPTAFEAAAEQENPAPIVESEAIFSDNRVQFVNESLTASERPSLENARVIISGGRAFQNTENFHGLLEPLADKLNAAIGASRAAVDAGYAPNDYQVGQTGKVVAPELYMAIGISGAIQHLAGMKESKVIVAINKDPDAPVFQVADYGLVGDLFQVIPELMEKL